MKNSITRILGVGAALLLAVTIQLRAQSTAFTYQGSLSNNGSPAVGNHDLRFRIYDALNNGNALGGPLTNSAVAVASGLFTTSLDFGAGVFDGGNRWLEIGVRPAGSANDFTTLTPRQPLTATPYAVKALEASAVPTGTITSAMLADGAVTSAKIAAGAVNQLGSPDGSPLAALQVNTNGLVGIGTSSPSAGLHLTASQSFLNLEVLSAVRDESGSYTNLGGAAGVAVHEDLVAIVGVGDSGITLLGLADPSTPVWHSQIRDEYGAFTNLYRAVSAAMKKDILAVAAMGDNAVTLIDVSNPSNPIKLAELLDGVGGWDELNGAYSVAIDGSLMAVAALNDSAVTLVDISNPSAPIKLAQLKDGLFGFDYLQTAAGVAIQGNLLAIAAGFDNAVTLVDVTDPTNPVKLSEIRDGFGGFNSLSGASGIALSGSLMAVAASNDDAVTLLDISDPANPVKLAEWKDSVNADGLDGASSVTFSGSQLAATAAFDHAVTLFDVSNPANPSVLTVARQGVGGFNDLSRPLGVAFVGANLVVAAADSAAVTVAGPFNRPAGLSSVGWVGIGTLRPAGALHVMGNVVVEQAARVELNAVHFEAGLDTTASGLYSTALGYYTTASGDYSTAMGYLAEAKHQGTLVWGDSSIYSTIASVGPNSVTMRASGGYWLYSNPYASAGVSLAPNATAWSVISDRAVKKDFAAVDSREVLEKLAAVPVQRWHYQWESAEATPHLGPVAQDFKAAFYPGRDDKSITTLEFDGVALAAIQGLNQKLEEELHRRDGENAELKEQNAELLKRLEAIEARLR